MRFTSLTVLLAITGCVTEAEEGDPIDGSFLAEGKADGTIAEDTAEAAAVLQLANNASESRLRLTGISTRAIEAIMASGRTFETLAELDAVKYVGEATFARLLDYAQGHGFVTPLPINMCNDGLSAARVADLVKLETTTGGGAVWARARECTVARNCTEWTPYLKVGDPEELTVTVTKNAGELIWSPRLNNVIRNDQIDIFSWTAKVVDYHGAVAYAGNTGLLIARDGSESASAPLQNPTFTLTDTCARMTSTLEMPIEGGAYGDRIDEEYTVLLAL